MTDTNPDTRSKILTTARILFAKNGFEGTSVRDIAKIADVNVASVNYHFSSKEKLFSEIMDLIYEECSQEINTQFKDQSRRLEDAFISVFHYFLDHSDDILSYFKMMLSSEYSHHMSSSEGEDGYYGPPGGLLVSLAIKREVGDKASEEDIHWALKTLFSHVTHISIIHNCCQRDNANVPYSSLADLENGIRRLTRVVIRELKNPQESSKYL